MTATTQKKTAQKKEPVKTGLYGTPGAYLKAFAEEGIYVNEWTDSVLKRIVCSDKKESLQPHIAPAKNLGFRDAVYYADICDGAKRRCLELLPSESAFALALHIQRMPVRIPIKGRLYMAMKPIRDHVGDLCIFYLEHMPDGRLSLNCDTCPPDRLWAPVTNFVFVA